MESLHYPEARKWISRQAINLADHFARFSDEVKRVQARDRPSVPKVRTSFVTDCFPTNVARVNLVMGCPNFSANVRIMGEKNLIATQILTPSLITTTQPPSDC